MNDFERKREPSSRDPKPLQYPCPVTRTPDGVEKQRWGFSGTPLEQSDVDALSAKGVRWWCGKLDDVEGDLMPDGRLKFPKYRSDYRNNANKGSAERDDFVTKMQAERWEVYMALPEPRPSFEKWAIEYSQRHHFEAIERIAINGKRRSDRVKAMSTLWEFSKVKPKQVVENLNPPAVAATPEQIMDAFKLIFLNGVPDADTHIAELLKQVPKQ